MDDLRLAPTVGIVAAFAVLAVLLSPYLLVDDAASVWTYYDAGAVNAVAVGLFAVLAVVVFAAGRQGRSEPDLAAGATLTLGLVAVAVAAAWALTVPESLVTQLTTATILLYHRGALVVAALILPAASLWYARALRLF